MSWAFLLSVVSIVALSKPIGEISPVSRFLINAFTLIVGLPLYALLMSSVILMTIGISDAIMAAWSMLKARIQLVLTSIHRWRSPTSATEKSEDAANFAMLSLEFMVSSAMTIVALVFIWHGLRTVFWDIFLWWPDPQTPLDQLLADGWRQLGAPSWSATYEAGNCTLWHVWKGLPRTLAKNVETARALLVWLVGPEAAAYLPSKAFVQWVIAWTAYRCNDWYEAYSVSVAWLVLTLLGMTVALLGRWLLAWSKATLLGR